MQQGIRYCASGDGTTIAYVYDDHGREPPVVFAGHSLVPMESQGARGVVALPSLRGAIAEGRRSVSFDRRGIGYSQRDVPEITADAQLDDLTAVISHAGVDRFDLVGLGDGCVPTVAYAALHPEAVPRLALVDPPPERTEKSDAFSALIRTNWSLGRRAIVDTSLGDLPVEQRRERIEILRRTVAPEIAAQYVDMAAGWQPGSQLSSIRAATLVVKSDSALKGPIDRARSLVAMIPNARLVVLNEKVYSTVRAFLESDEVAPIDAPEPPSMQAARGVTAVLFTDLVGHTEMMQRLGDERGRDVLREHERITRETLRQHGGAEVKTMGDGFMASFGSVTSAMDCAIALQRAFAAHTESMPEPLHVRVGLNAGEPIEEDGDLFGATVIMASRIAAQAGAGEILLPETLRHLLSGKSYVYADRGETMLKGFEDAVRLYEVRWRQ